MNRSLSLIPQEEPIYVVRDGKEVLIGYIVSDIRQSVTEGDYWIDIDVQPAEQYREARKEYIHKGTSVFLVVRDFLDGSTPFFIRERGASIYRRKPCYRLTLYIDWVRMEEGNNGRG